MEKQHLFLMWGIVADILAYGGCIGQSKSDRVIWVILTVCGQIVGAITLSFILVDLLA